MNFTITTLVENAVAQSGKALLGEHGLSFYIESGMSPFVLQHDHILCDLSLLLLNRIGS